MLFSADFESFFLGIWCIFAKGKIPRRLLQSCEMLCSELWIETPDWRQWCCSGVLIVNLEHLLLFQVFFLLTLNMLMFWRVKTNLTISEKYVKDASQYNVKMFANSHIKLTIPGGIYLLRCLLDVYLNWLNWFHFLILEGDLLVILIDCVIFLSPFLDITRMSTSTVSFLTKVDPGILCL